jgi:hypothetical protein
MYDYFLGGKDHFDIDKEAAQIAAKAHPGLPMTAQANRAFMHRATRVLAQEHGIRQWLDIGTGIPTADNTHAVAQTTAPGARVVYVDNDPIVLVHARALLESGPDGVIDYVDGDLNRQDGIVQGAARTLDFGQPIAVLLLGILNFIVDDNRSYGIVRHLMGAVSAGSYLVVTHPTTDVNGAAVEESMRRWNESGSAPMTARTSRQLRQYFDGLELLEPGVVTCSAWRPDPGGTGVRVPVSEYCGVGRKP